MKSLETLIKLQKTRVDEQRQMLARLMDRLDQIEQTITQHTLQQALEQATVQENPTSALTYGAFLKKSIENLRQLEKQKRAAEEAIAYAHDKLSVLFEEQKRYEIAQADREAREEKQEQHRDRLLLDEIGSVQFIRHRGEE